MALVARSHALPQWYLHASIAVGAAITSAIVYAVGPTGHLLYVAYLIVPLQAALYLGRTEAWQALVINLAGFALVTGIRTSQAAPGWSWTAFLEESLVLVITSAALVPILSRIVTRLRATRTTFARLETGDLTVRVPDDAPDELGYLGVSMNRTTDGIAAIVRLAQRQGQELAAMAQQLSASARQLQSASQGISTTTQGLARGAVRPRSATECATRARGGRGGRARDGASPRTGARGGAPGGNRAAPRPRARGAGPRGRGRGRALSAGSGAGGPGADAICPDLPC